MISIIDEIGKAQSGKEDAAFCLIVESKGSTPRKLGAKMIVYSDGKIHGTIGGGNLEKKVIENALKQIELGKAALFTHDLLHQHNMCCGGTVKIYIEPIVKKKKLYIFGAGHTGKALSDAAAKLDFEVFVIDDREEYIGNITHEKVNCMHIEYAKALPALPFDENTYIVIMTYDHDYDREILAYCLKKPFSYLGMIGSKRKIQVTRNKFIEAGIGSEEELNRVDMPMGFDINADGPEEIAISILAKLIEVKNNVRK